MSKKVMIVDDDPFILFSTRELLESAGFDVITANSGSKCIEELKKGFKGVILMDIMMPGMDGWDTIREIADNNLLEGNIITVFTAKDIDEKTNAFKEYVIDYITKPFDPDELIAAVEEYFTYIEKNKIK
ncbi:MAG: response regulator [Thermoplasmata archaeon]|nr:MAG: response regulator [Thermoplasmata archaeon]